MDDVAKMSCKSACFAWITGDGLHRSRLGSLLMNCNYTIYTLPKQQYRLDGQRRPCDPLRVETARSKGHSPMKTVHPVQRVLPSDPRPPASTGIDSNAPIVCHSDRVEDRERRSQDEVEAKEWRAGRLSDSFERLSSMV